MRPPSSRPRRARGRDRRSTVGRPVGPRARGCAAAGTRHSPEPRRRDPESALRALTERERQVLALLSEGLAGKQIVGCWRINPKTVERHKTRIYSKLGVTNQAAAAGLEPVTHSTMESRDGTYRVCKGLPPSLALIAAAVIVGALAAWFTTEAVSSDDVTSPDRYTADVLILDARGEQFGSQSRGTEGVSLTTMAALVKLEGVSTRAADNLSGDESPSELASSVVATADTDTGILTITATAPTARRAERIAAAFARGLRDYLADQSRIELRLQIRGLEQQIAGMAEEEGTRGGDDTLRFSLESRFHTPDPARRSDRTPHPRAIRCRGNRGCGPDGPDIAVRSRPDRCDRGAARGDGVGARSGAARSEDHHLEDRRGCAPVPAPRGDPRARRSRGLAVVDRPTSPAADAFRLLASSTLHALEQARSVPSEGNGHGAIPKHPCSR